MLRSLTPLLMLHASAAFASTADVRLCLDRNDVACAQAELDAMGARSDPNPNIQALVAEVAFYAGDYPTAFDTLSVAVENGWQDRYERLALYERTLYTTSGWTEVERDDFHIRYLPGADAVLVEDAATALAATVRYTVPLIGEEPPGPTVVELFPDAKSFIASSSLTEEDVRTTGIVGLSKWSRLLVTSPRVLGRGYGWQETLSHEYLHLVIARATNDKAPVWLQEGIAKYLDGRYRTVTDDYMPTIHQQGLIDTALAENDLVTFDEMHPSLAKLPTAERAALAYAQLATLLKFAFQQGGDQLLLRALPRVGDGEDPRIALATEAGFADFETFERSWRAWLGEQPYVQRNIETLPTVVEGVSDIEGDPILSQNQDLARWVRLGDLLLERERPEAALVEYAKAVPPDAPESPLTANRIARAHIELGDTLSARLALTRSLENYPEFTLTHKTLGEIYRLDNNAAQARISYARAVSLNPFDWEVQQALADLYAEGGDTAQATVHANYLRILRRGGQDLDLPILHERTGDVVLPSSRGSSSQQELVGQDAPAIDAQDMDGNRIRLSDHAGKVIVLDFWATWCGPCRASIPHLAELHATAGDDLAVIGITDEEVRTVERFRRRTDMPYTVARDPNSATKRSYGVSSLPTMAVIGKDGRIVATFKGWSEGVRARLDAAIRTARDAPALPGEMLIIRGENGVP